MSGDVILAWVLGGLVAGSWYLSLNRVKRDEWAELAITSAIWLAAGLCFFVAIVAVSR